MIVWVYFLKQVGKRAIENCPNRERSTKSEDGRDPKSEEEKVTRTGEKNEEMDDVEMLKCKRIWKKYSLETVEEMCNGDEQWTTANRALQQLYKELLTKVPTKSESNNQKAKQDMEVKEAQKGDISTIQKEEKQESHESLASLTSNLSEWLQCSLCLSLLVEPITLPCGMHIHIRIYAIHFVVACYVLVSLTVKKKKKKKKKKGGEMCQQEYKERQCDMEKEKKKLKKTTPVFILNQLLFPGQFLSLHLFEPRYLHLINRVISADRHFAYVAKMHRGEGYEPKVGDIGLLVFVEECEFLPDGRCLLRAVGTQRIQFKDCWTENGTQGLWYVQYEEYLDRIGNTMTCSSQTDKQKETEKNSNKHPPCQLEMKWITTLEQFVNQIYQSSRLTVNALEDQIGSRVHLVYDPLNHEKNNLSQYSLFVSALFSLCTRNSQSASCDLFKLQDPIQRIKILYEVIYFFFYTFYF
ncbi:hypothetical protein RFI_16149 [Reticulomyxa filosa]|uniref:Lon N-terminal domain-containing protein n=1 Tax=Reticulomyxa filosa TaxID=46433 RepID=X6N446_RETFI|nr:hypothetical protein RFI_16149 [Reticulomyxa filosa]|eukprot:ETO21055.1 hypothetical protein RFI_16149 [Reticulomyxa filosa]